MLSNQELTERVAELQSVLESTLGEIIAVGVTVDDYMENYAAQHCEYVEGVVIQMTPARLEHSDMLKYLIWLLDYYLELRPIGKLIVQPFVMRLPAFPNRRREPDLLVVLNDNPHELKSGYLDGPADICIEIVSEESVERDYGDKFNEYERGGVGEYWLIDQIRAEAHFYRLSETGRYESQPIDAEGNYHCAKLPGLRVHVPTLWADQLPGPAATVQAVTAMLANSD